VSAPDGLRSFQRRMAAAVMAPLTSRETMVRRRPDGAAMEAEAAAFVKPNDRLSSFERLEIYNRQYWLRVLHSLREDFPGLRAVLGTARFERLARAYLAQCPSVSFTLRNLGSRLESWLRDQLPAADPRRELALDMVRLEWAHIEAFDAGAEPPLDLGADGLQESTRLGLQPHLRLLRVGHGVDRLLLQARAAGEGPVRRPGLPRPEPVCLAVHRPEFVVCYKRLEPEAFRILEALGAGAALGGALQAGFTGSAMPEADRPGFLQASFHDWAALGWLTRPLD